MYRGFPIGYFLFWENGFTDDARVIGTDGKQKVPSLLIVDGQQRLTSLYAVIKGIPVLRDNYDAERIEIAFNPLHETFEVADAAIRRDKSYITDISSLWSDAGGLFTMVGSYLSELAKHREVSAHEKRHVEGAVTRVYNLLKFPFTALELSKEVDEEQVAEVFVRINSKGKSLNQADFILTLMSVFWDAGRAQLEQFCRESRRPSKGTPSPFNHYIQPDPDQLLRVAVGVGFKRARLQYVYSLLRGKDLDTEEFSNTRRDEQFGVLKEAQSRVLNLQYWHDFMKAVAAAGYAGGGLITSNNALLFTYVLYLIGRTEYDVEEHILRKAIAKWFFMAALTGRYTVSPESRLEFDLARFRETKDGQSFLKVLDAVCDAELTNDFWTITLPNDLATSSPRSPSLFAYYAALVLLDAKALFSDQKVLKMLDPSIHANRAAVERHHLFPKGYLEKLNITDIRDTNQIANYALVEWGDNVGISKKAPEKYVPVMQKRFKPRDLQHMYYWHALPEGWGNLDYQTFLTQRRELIAKVIRDGYGCLTGAKVAAGDLVGGLTVETLVAGGEGTTTEFKSTLRVSLHSGQPDPRMELAVVRTIGGFINSKGGTLVIGIADDGTPVGVPEPDQFKNEDKMNLHLVNLISSRIGTPYMMYVHPRFEDYQGVRVMAVDCWPGKSPVFVKDGNAERFFIRAGASTAELAGSKAQEYVKLRFKN
jgi:hypothetical protein